jgi:hypothetical protein
MINIISAAGWWLQLAYIGSGYLVGVDSELVRALGQVELADDRARAAEGRRHLGHLIIAKTHIHTPSVTTQSMSVSGTHNRPTAPP